MAKKTTAKKPTPKPRRISAPDPLSQHFRIPPIQIRLAETETDGKKTLSIPARIEVFKSGVYTKRYPDGSEKTFKVTTSHLDQMVENFEEGTLGIDLALDFGHDAGGEAAAWFTSLTREGDTLFADVDWTEEGRKKASGKGYRYTSPDFTFNYIDPKTKESHGALLFGAGLTNRPVIKTMTPVVELSEVDQMAKKNTKKVTTKAISEMDQAELEFLLSEETDESRRSFAQYRLDEMTMDEDDAAEESDTEAPKTFAEMTDAEKLAAYEAKCAEVEEMKGKNAMTAAEVAKIKKDKEFDGLLAKGKVVEAQRVHFHSGDTVKFAESFVPTKFTTVGSGVDADDEIEEGSTETPVQDKVLKLAEEKVAAKKARTTVEGISMILSENVKLRKEYDLEMSREEA